MSDFDQPPPRRNIDTGASLFLSMMGIAVLLVFFIYAEPIMVNFFTLISSCQYQACTDYVTNNRSLFHFLPWIGIIALLANIGVVMLRRTSDRQEKVFGGGYDY